MARRVGSFNALNLTEGVGTGQHRDARSSSVGRKPPASAVAAELRQREERLHSVPDVIKTRNASFPVVRSAHGPLQDVEGVIVHAPETFSSQLFEEYGGKILMVSWSCRNRSNFT